MNRSRRGKPDMVKLTALLWRCAVVLLDKVAPGFSGKLATDRFLFTRGYGNMRTQGAPLGASVVPVTGCEGISHAYVWGDAGPLVFLIHGWGADSGSMCSLVKPFRAKGCRVVAFDAPGHGSNPGHQTTMRDFVASVRHMIDGFEPQREVAAVIGHSLGGLAVIAALGRVRRLPAKLVLIAAPSCLNDTLLIYLRQWGFSERIGNRIRRDLDKSHGVPIEYWDVRTLGFKPAMPTLILHDALDGVVKPAQADLIALHLGGNARVEKTRGLGHIRILADEAAKELIRDFMDKSGEESWLPAPEMVRR
jgi:pimeloyl-ACP methyl ester carboxylesterase